MQGCDGFVTGLRWKNQTKRFSETDKDFFKIGYTE